NVPALPPQSVDLAKFAVKDRRNVLDIQRNWHKLPDRRIRLRFGQGKLLVGILSTAKELSLTDNKIALGLRRGDLLEIHFHIHPAPSIPVRPATPEAPYAPAPLSRSDSGKAATDAVGPAPQAAAPLPDPAEAGPSAGGSPSPAGPYCPS